MPFSPVLSEDRVAQKLAKKRGRNELRADESGLRAWLVSLHWCQALTAQLRCEAAIVRGAGSLVLMS